MTSTIEKTQEINTTEDINENKDTSNNIVGIKKKHPFKKHFSKKTKNLENQEYTSNKNPYDNLFSLIRIKHNVKESDFLQALNDTLLTNEFKNIVKNEISILSYSALYNNKEIFNLILNNYKSSINEEDFIKNTFKYSIYKDYSILDNYLSFLDENFKVSSEFINNFTLELSKTSYRIDNNKIALHWLEDKVNDDLIKSFWDSAIEYKNIPIILLALSFNKFKTFLSVNLNYYEDSLIKIGRFNEVKQVLFSDKPSNFILPNKSTLEINEISTDDSFKQNPIIIKKKKRIL